MMRSKRCAVTLQIYNDTPVGEAIKQWFVLIREETAGMFTSFIEFNCVV